jgi:hypothetical protein
MVRRIVLGILAVMVLAPLPVEAQRIPPGNEATVLGLFAPFGIDAPADQITETVRLESVAINETVVEVTLVSESSSVAITLVPHDKASGTVVAKSSSFSFITSTTGIPADLQTATDKLIAAVSANDSGSFWTGMEPEPDLSAEGIPDQPLGGLGLVDYVGEFLLLLLLVLSILAWPAIKSCIGVQKWSLSVAILIVFGLGLGYRMLVRSEDELLVDEQELPCAADEDCIADNPCLTGTCESGFCAFEPGPNPDVLCCQIDTDCPVPEERCIEAFCGIDDTWQCGTRPSATCEAVRYEGVGDFRLHVSQEWFYAIAAKWTGNTVELSTESSLWLSALAVPLLVLVLLAWGLSRSGALGAAGLLAISPLSLVAAQTASTVSFVFFITLLLLLWTAPLVRNAASLSKKLKILTAMLVGVLYFILVSARLEALLALIPAALLLVREKRWQALGAIPLAVLGSWTVLAVSLRAMVMTGADLALSYPALSTDYITDFSAGMDLLFVSGMTISILQIIMSIIGLVVMFRTNRDLWYLCLFLTAGLFIWPIFFTFPTDQLVRFALIPSLGLLIPAGVGFRWLREYNPRYSWMVTVILVLYFLFFPLSRLESLLDLIGEFENDIRFLIL